MISLSPAAQGDEIQLIFSLFCHFISNLYFPPATHSYFFVFVSLEKIMTLGFQWKNKQVETVTTLSFQVLEKQKSIDKQTIEKVGGDSE